MPTDQEAIVLAAIAAAGPAADDPESWSSRVAELSAMVAAMLTPQSDQMRRAAAVVASKVFTAELRSVRREMSSDRVVIELRTNPTKFHPDGVELARTERLDSGGRALARRCRELVGHRVKVWVEVQEISGGAKKVRVLQHIEDLGVIAAPAVTDEEVAS